MIDSGVVASGRTSGACQGASDGRDPERVSWLGPTTSPRRQEQEKRRKPRVWTRMVSSSSYVIGGFHEAVTGLSSGGSRQHGNIPSVGALSGTTGPGSERVAAQPPPSPPPKRTADRPTTRPTRRFRHQIQSEQGRHAVSGTSSGGFFLEEVAVEQSPETRRCALHVVPNL